LLRANCGGQPYFVCMPSKFNQDGSGKITIFYSANWSEFQTPGSIDRPGLPAPVQTKGPGGAYSLCVAEFQLDEGSISE
jgi:hypothetical protein